MSTDRNINTKWRCPTTKLPHIYARYQPTFNGWYMKCVNCNDVIMRPTPRAPDSCSDKYCMVSCPSCGRPAGQYCLHLSTDTVHTARIRAYDRWKASLVPARWQCTYCGNKHLNYTGPCVNCNRPYGHDHQALNSVDQPRHPGLPEPSSAADRNKERRLDHMAANQYTVYLPDNSRPLYFSKEFTPGEVKSALISSGQASVENSTMTVSADGNTITFARVQGGTKGL